MEFTVTNEDDLLTDFNNSDQGSEQGSEQGSDQGIVQYLDTSIEDDADEQIEEEELYNSSNGDALEEDPIIHHIEELDKSDNEEPINVYEDNEETAIEDTNVVLNKLKIPKRIFQTHKSIQYVQNTPHLRNAINSWKQFVPEFGYHFYTDEMCELFMKNVMVEEFGNIIYEAYSKLPISVMKADLWRYCVIYKFGGIYADADAICRCNPNMFTLYDTLLVCAPENPTHLCQWCFAAPAKSEILKHVIELSINRIMSLTKFKGEHLIHYLTGPGVFTDGIEQYLKENKMMVFKDRSNYYRYKNQTMICFAGERFHNSMIEHLFTGGYSDGWIHERNAQFM
jgi:mannosyltransferase OCH1-like enzyme